MQNMRPIRVQLFLLRSTKKPIQWFSNRLLWAIAYSKPPGNFLKINLSLVISNVTFTLKVNLVIIWPVDKSQVLGNKEVDFTQRRSFWMHDEKFKDFSIMNCMTIIKQSLLLCHAINFVVWKRIWKKR